MQSLPSKYYIDENRCTLKGTVNDLINVQGVYLILGVLGKALNRYEALIREKRSFHFHRNNVDKTNKTRSLLAE